MHAHELARLLLAGPDLPVVVTSDLGDDLGQAEVVRVRPHNNWDGSPDHWFTARGAHIKERALRLTDLPRD